MRLRTMRLCVRSLASLRGLRIWHCHGRWCRSQMQFGSGVAVAVVQASSCSSNWTPSLGTAGVALEKTKKKKKLNVRVPTVAHWVKDPTLSL